MRSAIVIFACVCLMELAFAAGPKTPEELVAHILDSTNAKVNDQYKANIGKLVGAKVSCSAGKCTFTADSAVGKMYKRTQSKPFEVAVSKIKISLDVSLKPCRATIHLVSATIGSVTPATAQKEFEKVLGADFHTKLIRKVLEFGFVHNCA